MIGSLLLLAFVCADICRAVVIASYDNRACNDGFYAEHPLIGAAIAANAMYAVRHGYAFWLFCAVDTPGLHPSWGKVLAARVLLQLYADLNETIILLDSDAFFIAANVGVTEYMHKHGVYFERASFNLMFSRESYIPGKLPEPYALNAGVWYMYSGGGDDRIETALYAIDELMLSVCQPACRSFAQHWPLEQGCILRLRATSEPFARAVNVTFSHMNVWNGPWGQFVRHVWSGPGHELFEQSVSEALLQYDFDARDVYARIVRDNAQLPLSFKCEERISTLRRR